MGKGRKGECGGRGESRGGRESGEWVTVEGGGKEEKRGM